MSAAISHTNATQPRADGGPAWSQPIQAEMAQVESALRAFVPPDIPIAGESFEEAIDAGGKRLRPGLTLLCAGATGGIGNDALTAAVVVEVIHLASLMHDDVIDEAETRRGRPATRVRWGNRTSVLMGDLLAAEAYRALSCGIGDWATQLLCRAVVAMCNGQFLDVTSERGQGGEAQYLRVIAGKTGALFQAACEIGARVGAPDADGAQALTTYGMSLGMAFQIVDDLMDLYADPQAIGKPLGNDLRTGQYTLPILSALQHDQAHELRAALDGEVDRLSPAEIRRIADLTDTLGGRDYAVQRARAFADGAVQQLALVKPSVYRDALEAACQDVMARVP